MNSNPYAGPSPSDKLFSAQTSSPSEGCEKKLPLTRFMKPGDIDVGAVSDAGAPESESRGLINNPTPLEDILYYRYGFVYSPGIRRVTDPPDMGQRAKYFGESKARMPVSTGLRQAIVEFSNALLSCWDSAKDLRDLEGGSLREFYNNSAVISVECSVGDVFSFASSPEQRDCYILRPCTRCHENYLTILYDPEAVLQVIRNGWGPNITDIIVQLMNAGIPFTTRILKPNMPHQPRTQLHLGLGFQPYMHVIGAADYDEYLEERKSILRGGCARAALMRGGMISRIARDVLGDRAGPMVLAGPTESVVQDGTALRIGKEYYWDDDLTEREEAVICGVYKFSTGQRHNINGQQVADVSWWPKQAAWEASAHNMGYWTSDNEEWYQKRLANIRDYLAERHPEKSILKNAAEWRNTLKGYKRESRIITNHNRQAAKEFLHSL